jgi:hypothetical protein
MCFPKVLTLRAFECICASFLGQSWRTRYFVLWDDFSLQYFEQSQASLYPDVNPRAEKNRDGHWYLGIGAPLGAIDLKSAYFVGKTEKGFDLFTEQRHWEFHMDAAACVDWLSQLGGLIAQNELAYFHKYAVRYEGELAIKCNHRLEDPKGHGWCVLMDRSLHVFASQERFAFVKYQVRRAEDKPATALQEGAVHCETLQDGNCHVEYDERPGSQWRLTPLQRYNFSAATVFADEVTHNKVWVQHLQDMINKVPIDPRRPTRADATSVKAIPVAHAPLPAVLAAAAAAAPEPPMPAVLMSAASPQPPGM